MAGEAQVRVTGGCGSRGALQLAALPTRITFCHCRTRQKAGGRPFVAFATVPGGRSP